MRLCFQALIVAGVLAAAGSARANLVTGFESPGYAVGNVAGQQGWTDNASTDSRNVGLWNVSAANPKSGTQALSVGDGGYFAPTLISPATATTGSTLTSFNFNIAGANTTTAQGARHDVYVVSNAAADVDLRFGFNNYAGGVSFQPDGRILVETFSTDFGGGMSLNETGVNWTPNAYHTFSISVNKAAATMVYTYDGVVIASTKAFYETSVGNVVFRNDSSVVAGELASFDNLSVTAIPEPTTLAMLGASALSARRRRAIAR